MRRALAALANRDAQREYLEQIVREVGVDLSPVSAWLLVRFEQDPGVDPDGLASAHTLDRTRIASGVVELETRGLIAPVGGNGAHGRGVTRAGCEVLGKIVAVRRAHIARAAAEWGAGDARIAESVQRIQRELVPDARPSGGE